MRCPCLILLALPWSGLAAAAADRPAHPPAPRAGWFGVFLPSPSMYTLTFTAPVVNDPKKPTAYRQTARYEWIGGRYEVIEVTLARDPALAKTYADAALKDPPVPQKVAVGKTTGLLWDLRTDGAKFDAVSRRLVVPLADAKVVIFEQRGFGLDLVEFARKHNLAAIAAALDRPPRTDFRRTLDDFKVLQKNISYGEVVAWVGPADADIGSGMHLLVYNLPDGSRVLLGFPSFEKLLFVKHEKDGRVEELVKSFSRSSLRLSLRPLRFCGECF